MSANTGCAVWSERIRRTWRICSRFPTPLSTAIRAGFHKPATIFQRAAPDRDSTLKLRCREFDKPALTSHLLPHEIASVASIHSVESYRTVRGDLRNFRAASSASRQNIFPAAVCRGKSFKNQANFRSAPSYPRPPARPPAPARARPPARPCPRARARALPRGRILPNAHAV